VALSSWEVFKLLNVPLQLPVPPKPAVVLNGDIWKRHYHGGGAAIGQIIEIGATKAVVAGVLPASQWRLPGNFDAWLLAEDGHLEVQPAESKGFLLARVHRPPRKGQHLRQWRVSVFDAQARRSYRFEVASLDQRPSAVGHLLVICLALLILPISPLFHSGHYPSTALPAPASTLIRWYLFLAAKFIFSGLLAFLAVLLLACITSTPLQPLGWLFGYVLVFRWALKDQRQRCPVCLRKLTHPTRIGSNAQIFLELNITELMCEKGHGLLLVPEVETSYSTDRWLNLDASWAGLFETAKPHQPSA
jgi:hypothetical protein